MIYLSFSRPSSIIFEQLRLPDDCLRGCQNNLWVIDCYSKVYKPEGTLRRFARTLHADPRDPMDVYGTYMQALNTCRRSFNAVRVVYETLSDFLKVSDSELVFNYLRRVIVLEEERNIRAIYLYWQGAVTHQVDATYLRWFFSATLDIAMPDPMTQPARFQAMFTRFFHDPVSVSFGRDLRLDERAVFSISERRVGVLARSIRQLSFVTRPYGFLTEWQGAERARHLANFLFFMAAIDHDTHRPSGKYEDQVEGRLLHGSDLLYALAQMAKRANPDLFLPAAFEDVSDDIVARLFTSPSGRLPADVHGRAEIFRATARQLIADFGGDAALLIERCGRRLSGETGLLKRLQGFAAFQDPIGKKTALLAKLLLREGLFEPHDPERLEIAVDHVVMTMSLRSGMVRCEDPSVRQKITSGSHLDPLEMGILREVTKEAVRLLPQESGLRADELDDLIWSYGRISLRRATPLDFADQVHSDLDPQLDADALPQFVSVLNGRDSTSDEAWPEAATVRGPFTRFY